MSYFPINEEKISLIKFIAKYQYLNVEDAKYFFNSSRYYRNRIKNLIDKRFLRKIKWTLVLGQSGMQYANNLLFNLDNDLSERKLGNLKELGEFMKDKETRDPSQEQLLDRTFRTSDGESAEQTKERMNNFFDRILKEYCGKRIAVVSHGGSIKFFLLNWCAVNEDVKLVYNNENILNIKSPCLLKLTFRENELINLEQID